MLMSGCPSMAGAWPMSGDRPGRHPAPPGLCRGDAPPIVPVLRPGQPDSLIPGRPTRPRWRAPTRRNGAADGPRVPLGPADAGHHHLGLRQAARETDRWQHPHYACGPTVTDGLLAPSLPAASRMTSERGDSLRWCAPGPGQGADDGQVAVPLARDPAQRHHHHVDGLVAEGHGLQP